MANDDEKPTFLNWLGYKNRYDWSEHGWVGRLLGKVFFAFVVIALAFAMVAAITVMFHTSAQVLRGDDGQGPSLGAGTLIIGLLGAPFLIWRTLVAQRTVDIAQENHITDLINKAVEGLGSETKRSRIGRPVRIYSDRLETEWVLHEEESDFRLPEKAVLVRRGREDTILDDGNTFDGWAFEIARYRTDRTEIEWQDNPIKLPADEAIGMVGDWQVFEETRPNIEVRIGAILALEQLAKNNPDEVHIQIMEILTAYIRENAPASAAATLPSCPQYNSNVLANFGEQLEQWKTDHLTALEGIRPRGDIQTALTVIGRRGDYQKALERGPVPCFEKSSLKPPECPAPNTGGILSEKDIDRFKKEAQKCRDKALEWRETDRPFRIDLRRANLQGADLRKGDFEGAQLVESLMEGTDLRATNLAGAELTLAQMQSSKMLFCKLDAASLWRSELQGAELRFASLKAASLYQSHLEGADSRYARMEAARLLDTRLQMADLREAHLEGAEVLTQRLQGSDMREVYRCSFETTL